MPEIFTTYSVLETMQMQKQFSHKLGVVTTWNVQWKMKKIGINARDFNYLCSSRDNANAETVQSQTWCSHNLKRSMKNEGKFK